MTQAEFLKSLHRETPDEHDARVSEVAEELDRDKHMTFYALEMEPS